MQKDAQITVFLSLVFICIVSLLLVLAESARMAGMRYSVQMAAGSSLDSVMSQYHRELWDEYRILLLDMSETQIETEIKKYLSTYALEDADIVIENAVQAVDNGAFCMEKEIADYMKYGVWVMDFDETEIEHIWDRMAGADSLAHAAKRFEACTKEALKLEKTVKKLSDALEKQNTLGDDIWDGISLHREDMVKKAGRAYQNENQNIKKYIRTYEQTAKKMREKLETARRENQQEKELEKERLREGELGEGKIGARKIGEEIQTIIAEEEARYDSYIALDGERYQKVLQAGEVSEKNAQVIQEVMELAEAAEEDNGEDDKENGESEESGDGDTWTTWHDVSTAMRAYEAVPILLQKTQGDEKKAEILEKLKEWMEGDILTLLLGKNAKISQGKIGDSNLPSKKQTERKKAVYGAATAVTETVTALQVNAYIREYFQNFRNTGSEKEIQYEQEYLLAGKSTDRENLKSAVQQILAVRAGLNLMYLYTDRERREEASELATMILGSAGLAPLAPVLSFFILSVWASAEAMTDTKSLLEGEQVPIWKTKTEWKLGLDGLLKMGEQKVIEIKKESSGQAEHLKKGGTDYGGYVRLLLLLKTMKEKMYRMLDIMQMNIGRRQQGFEIGDCYYSVGITIRTDKKHFFHAGKWAERTFTVQAAVEKAY